jgi:hypothetical protein
VKRKPLWFQPWAALGYTLQAHRRGGHVKVFDPNGTLVTVMSCTPRVAETPRRATEQALRKHHARHHAGGYIQ